MVLTKPSQHVQSCTPATSSRLGSGHFLEVGIRVHEDQVTSAALECLLAGDMVDLLGPEPEVLGPEPELPGPEPESSGLEVMASAIWSWLSIYQLIAFPLPFGRDTWRWHGTPQRLIHGPTPVHRFHHRFLQWCQLFGLVRSDWGDHVVHLEIMLGVLSPNFFWL